MNVRVVRRARDVAAAAAAVLIMICLAVSLTAAFRPLYYFDVNYLDVPQKSGYSAQECRENYDALIDYNLLFGEDELILPDMTTSEEGRIHFAEVKEIFIAMQIASICGLAALAVWALFHRRGKLTEANTRWMKYTAPLALFIVCAVVLAMLIDWQRAFAAMHAVLFDNDYWLFNPATDPVIKILPDEFFFHCGIMIAVLTSLQTAILEIVYYKVKYGKR